MSDLGDPRSQAPTAATPAQPRFGRGARVAAFIGALTAAAGAVVGVTIYVVRQPSPSSPAASVGSPSPPPASAFGAAADSGIRDHGAPPPGLPVVYVAYPEKPTWLQAIGWDGRIVGTVKLPDSAGPKIYDQGTILGGVKASPDGSLVKVQDAVYDQAGKLVGTLPSETRGPSLWGDDNRRLCSIIYDRASSTAALAPVLVLDEPGKPVHGVARFPEAPQAATGYGISSCSPRHDRAIVTSGLGIASSEWWLVRLSDGAVLHHEGPAPARSISLVASPDTTLTAANSAAGTGAAPAAVVSRTADGTQVKTYQDSEVIAFTGDSQRVMLFHGPEDTPTYDVVGLADGTQQWHYGGPDHLAAGTVEPGGQGFALALAHPGPQLAPCQDLTGRNCPRSQSALDSVVILRPDGGEVAFGDGLIPGW